MVLHYFLINPQYDLHRDEYLHLDQANHLAWGYLSVPPLTSWIACLIKMLGNSVFWVKFFPALFGGLTIAVVWKTIEELKGNLFALILGAIAVTFSAIMRINILFQPNSFDILAWTFLYFAVIKFINTANNKWLWMAALGFALGFLNKYNICFLLLGILPALLLSSQRKIFANRHFYLSMSLALIIILPNLIWQFQNGFPVLHHMEILRRTQLKNINRFDFLKEQALFFIGSIFIIIAAFIAFLSYAPFKKYRLFGWAYIFTLLIFIYFKAKPYYAIGLYPVLLAFGAVYLEQFFASGWKKYLRPVAILVPLLLFIPAIRLIFPILGPAEILQKEKIFKALGMLRWEDGKDHELPQDFADMLGWRELAEKVDHVYDSIGNNANTIVLCDNYGEAGAINYYSKHRDINAVSYSADYINWFPLDKKEITTVIRVKEKQEVDKEPGNVKQFFETVILTGKIDNIFAREEGTGIFLFKAPKVSINEVLKKEIAQNR